MSNRTVPGLGLAAFVAVVPAALLHFVGGETVSVDGWFHFGGVRSELVSRPPLQSR